MSRNTAVSQGVKCLAKTASAADYSIGACMLGFRWSDGLSKKSMEVKGHDDNKLRLRPSDSLGEDRR
jgi:hypothetical protein